MSFYPDMCGLCFSRPSAHITDEGLFICGTCHQAIEDLKAEHKNVVDLERKDPSELCRKCGICCVVLSAKVDDAEAKEFHQQALNAGFGPQDFGDVFAIEELGPHTGDLVFRFPCPYLRGKPLDFVSCAGYSLDRPSVCRSYLCKIAIKYSLGLITIEEAQFTLRSSFLSGALDLFNWTHCRSDDPESVEQEIEEQKLIFYNHLNEQAQRMLDEGTPRDLVGMVVSSQITPVLDFKNAACHVLFNMHMQALDRDYIEPKVYVEEEIVDGWTPEKKVFATQIIKHVLTELRDLFATKSELDQLRGDQDGQEPEASGRDGGQTSSADEEEQAEAGDSGDDVDLGGREGVQHSGQHPEGARAGEGSGDPSDAAGEQDQCPSPGDGDGPEGARQEGGERRVDLVERIPEEEIERCHHDYDPSDEVCPECGCQLWSKEDYESREFGDWDGSVIPEDERYGTPPCSMEDLEGPNPYNGLYIGLRRKDEDRDRSEQGPDDEEPVGEPLHWEGRSVGGQGRDSEDHREGGDVASEEAAPVADPQRRVQPGDAVIEGDSSEDHRGRNRKIIEDIMGMIAESCTCPGKCPVHDDPRDKEPFDLESDGVDDLDFGLEEEDE